MDTSLPWYARLGEQPGTATREVEVVNMNCPRIHFYGTQDNLRIAFHAMQALLAARSLEILGGHPNRLADISFEEFDQIFLDNDNDIDSTIDYLYRNDEGAPISRVERFLVPLFNAITESYGHGYELSVCLLYTSPSPRD